VRNPDPVRTAHLFPGLHRHLVELLRGLEPEGWLRPTVAGSWRVRDVAAHLLDVQLRRLSFHRDGHPPPDPPAEDSDDGGRALVALLDRLNATWVEALDRVSPAVLVDLLDAVGPELADFMGGLDPDAPAFFPVAWAGAEGSRMWADVGRDYTELWHHQAQIRDAVGAPPLLQREWLHPVLALAVRSLPPALAGVRAETGAALAVRVAGDAGGTWTVRREPEGWRLLEGDDGAASASLTLPPDAAWRLFFHALGPEEARAAVSWEGDERLVRAALGARSVMV
jgi:uncharacterized protein (TIGR03083 family)